MAKTEEFVLCYRVKEDHVYRPLVDGSGKVRSMPLGEGQEKIDGASSEMILLDLEPINKKLRKIREYMKTDLESCKTTAKTSRELSVNKEKGIAYAQQFELSAKYLERYLKEIDKALPQLKDDSE